MAIQHTCHVDCRLVETTWMDREGVERPGVAHVMQSAEPSSAAGRYQWEQNAKIKRQGRRAWRATGQGQSRECRAWDHARLDELEAQLALGVNADYVDRPLSRARGRHLRALLESMLWD